MSLENNVRSIVKGMGPDVTYREREEINIGKIINLPLVYIEKVNKQIIGFNSMLILSISKRLKHSKTEHKVPEELFLIGELLRLKNIDDYVVLIVELMEYYEYHKKLPTVKQAVNGLYPNGFYSEETVRNILPCLQNNKHRQNLRS